MHIYLKDSAREFLPQVRYLSTQINLQIAENAADAEFSIATQRIGQGLHIVKNGKNAQISYSRPCEFFRGLLQLLKTGEKDTFDLAETAHFRMNGVMIDNSRNAVMNIDQTKCLIAYAALMGLDHIQLYIEDTFEVSGQPYFGHMRMRYTQDEIKKLNTFAKGFGILLIPCIQTLAHLNQMFKWNCYTDIKDIDDILLVGADKTYALIEDIIRSWRGCVDSNLIHIGMDEAHNLGRGQYADQNGWQPRYEIMCSHLRRVIEICHKYDFEPIMWSDMFFRMLYNGDYYADGDIAPELLAMIPQDVTLAYWDYYTLTPEGYDRQMKKHTAMPNKLCFAGGAWKWVGFLPKIDHSMEVSKYALQKAKENGIPMVFATAWGDDGAECPIFSVLPVLALYGEMNYYDGDADDRIAETVNLLTGYTLEEYRQLDFPNGAYYPTRQDYQNNPTKYLLYQDVLMGLLDRHIGFCNRQHFSNCTIRLQELADRNGKMAYLFDTAAKLCHVLAIKCDMGVRLKAAYDTGDKETMRAIAAKEIPELKKRLAVFHKVFKRQWYKVNKRGGFDVQDIRLGGLMARIQTAQEVILDYLDGNIDRIEELEQDRLPIGEDGRCMPFFWWTRMASTNIL